MLLIIRMSEGVNEYHTLKKEILIYIYSLKIIIHHISKNEFLSYTSKFIIKKRNGSYSITSSDDSMLFPPLETCCP
jgi:hypothetical protein